ncbi:MAG: hypothetical protein ACRDSZ_17755 [Pseudonocardiaceae bacterium]
MKQLLVSGVPASLALSFKGHLAWTLDDSQGVIALSRAAAMTNRN